MSKELFIITGVRICEMTDNDFGATTRHYSDKDRHIETLIEDRTFKLMNVLLVGEHGSLVVETKNVRAALRLFESIKLLLGFVELHYDDEIKVDPIV
ncbi:hypothetical protein, partial [Cytobacillus firmus]|nr:hypothetical protein [Cytobacillus firmus]